MQLLSVLSKNLDPISHRLATTHPLQTNVPKKQQTDERTDRQTGRTIKQSVKSS